MTDTIYKLINGHKVAGIREDMRNGHCAGNFVLWEGERFLRVEFIRNFRIPLWMAFIAKDLTLDF